MAQITLNSTGVASSGSLVLQSNGTTSAVTVDTSQNVGLGVTPSAWASGTYKAFQVSGGGAISGSTGQVNFSQNWVGESGADKYISNGFASSYAQALGVHKWFNAPSGTAGGTISFTQAMTLDASGNLLVNTTTAREKITVNGSIAASGQFIPYSGSTSLGYIGNDSSISGGSGSNIGLRSEAAMLFATGGSTERARIDSSGNLLVGTSSTLSNTAAHLQVLGISSDDSLAVFKNGSGRTAGNILFQNASGTQVGYIQVQASATAYVTSSDYRLKNNVTPMTGALAKVAALNPVTYKWNADGSDGEGFIAHELAEVCPHAVVGEKDAVDQDGNPVYQGIDTSFLVATLTAAIQELKAEFDAYKATHP